MNPKIFPRLFVFSITTAVCFAGCESYDFGHSATSPIAVSKIHAPSAFVVTDQSSKASVDQIIEVANVFASQKKDANESVAQMTSVGNYHYKQDGGCRLALAYSLNNSFSDLQSSVNKACESRGIKPEDCTLAQKRATKVSTLANELKAKCEAENRIGDNGQTEDLIEASVEFRDALNPQPDLGDKIEDAVKATQEKTKEDAQKAADKIAEASKEAAKKAEDLSDKTKASWESVKDNFRD